MYLYTKCQRWKKKKRKLIRKLEKEEVTFQALAEKKWLASLLTNKRTITPLLEYSKVTEIRAKERAGEKKQE